MSLGRRRGVSRLRSAAAATPSHLQLALALQVCLISLWSRCCDMSQQKALGNTQRRFQPVCSEVFTPSASGLQLSPVHISYCIRSDVTCGSRSSTVKTRLVLMRIEGAEDAQQTQQVPLDAQLAALAQHAQQQHRQQLRVVRVWSHHHACALTHLHKQHGITEGALCAIYGVASCETSNIAVEPLKFTYAWPGIQ